MFAAVWRPPLRPSLVADPFNPLDNQTCTYTYDDLTRISGDTCTFGQSTVWGQSFNYDAFGNITKNASVGDSWTPNYANSKNQYLEGWMGPNNTVHYDGSGRSLRDGFNTYTWDAWGDLASANGNNITYDAFGRMIENTFGSHFEQYLYPPTGGPALAWVHSQILDGMYLPLPGGAIAMIGNTGPFQYNHPDWLGSARLFSNTNRQPTPGFAYAPFGEGYAQSSYQWIQFTEFGNAWTVGGNNNQGPALDDFMFRRYSPGQGRWISPDPAGLAAVDPANPQTWNRYAYVADNPLSFVDPSGLCPDRDYSYTDANGNLIFHSDSGPCETEDRSTPAGGDDVASGNPNPFECGTYGSGPCGGNGPGTAANNGTWNWIKNAARKIGNYIPVSCGAGAFAYGGANVGSPASLAVAKWYQWDSIDGSSKGLFTELSGGEGVTGGVGAQATPGQNMEYYAFVGPGVKNVGPFSGNVSGFVSTDFSSYGSQGFAAEGAFGRATGGVGVYMNFMSLTACMDKAH